jgi:hypothetical protein
MQRLLIPALAAAMAVGGAWLAPTQAVAQNYDQNPNYNGSQNYNQNRNNRNYSQNRNNQGGATAWGDPWLNENDFDYNRRHWLPGPGDTGRYSGDYDRNQDRYGRNENNSNNDRYNGDNQYGNNYNRGYDNRYDRGDNRYNDDRSGLGRNYRPDNRYQYDDEDDE